MKFIAKILLKLEELKEIKDASDFIVSQNLYCLLRKQNVSNRGYIFWELLTRRQRILLNKAIIFAHPGRDIFDMMNIEEWEPGQ